MNLLALDLGTTTGGALSQHDGTGEKVARATGWPHWMSPVVGEDANDAHRRMGLIQLSQSIGAALRAKAA